VIASMTFSVALSWSSKIEWLFLNNKEPVHTFLPSILEF